MKLKNYRFGRVEGSDREYDSDLIVLDDWTHDWWRDSGHRVIPEDLEDLMPKKPARIVFGTGSSGRMSLTPNVKDFLRERGIDFEAMTTDRAIERYNQLVDEDERVAGAFHLTC